MYILQYLTVWFIVFFNSLFPSPPPSFNCSVFPWLHTYLINLVNYQNMDLKETVSALRLLDTDNQAATSLQFSTRRCMNRPYNRIQHNIISGQTRPYNALFQTSAPRNHLTPPLPLFFCFLLDHKTFWLI